MSKTLIISTRNSRPLRGQLRAPSDKSISHRALILGTSCVGETRVSNLLEADDIMATAKAMQQMGAQIEKTDDGIWLIKGVGTGGLSQPAEPLDFGNSGTGVRLCLGLVASHNMTVEFIGDASLSSRPMGRVLNPLADIGAMVVTDDQGQGEDRLPLKLKGARDPLPIEYTLPVASAQVKSAVLLAGLNTPGIMTVIEPQATRDHTERMLSYFGAEVNITPEGGGRRIELTGQPELVPGNISVPADPSSSAFPLVAALIVPGSEVLLEQVMLNPTRTGLITTLLEMGANITIENEREEGGETIGDLRVKASELIGVSVPAARAPSMIDEYPILCVAAAFASGETWMEGLGELRVKESDRLAAMAAGLEACGVEHEESKDALSVFGAGEVPGGGKIETHMDHRIAMAFLIMGLRSIKPIAIDDGSMIATSFPGFVEKMTALGATFG